MIEIQITATGGVQMLHDDSIDLAEMGPIQIVRASHVEWCSGVRWFVQSARTGKVLAKNFATRAEALEWEKAYYSPSGPGWRELTEEAREAA